MDKETRNRIQRATQAARALLEHEYAEQLGGVFDIRADGTVAPHAGSHLDAGQRVLRPKIVAAVEHHRQGGLRPGAAVSAYTREAAFTTLNRFVALKMLEARGLVQECISRGDQSAGFKEFVGLAPGLVQVSGHGYRLYIETIFDEVGREVRVLFDRQDPAGLLWPGRQALFDLLALLNAAELAEVWKEDETIGWVYQYFNGDDERAQMRDVNRGGSQAPRNSRELAVRNQFFTPRYVVQFLTDNTLGRIWYEMRRGDTSLRDLNYLVRRPTEIFLAHDQAPPPDEPGADLAQEEPLCGPTYVPFRVKKDPRDIRVLDPACGSGHFLLYAFDLLLVIYGEAWGDEAGPKSDLTGRGLRQDYPDLDSLHASVPDLILRHNLHGIDIDPRCAQIAALALWMRAQRDFNGQGISRESRPRIQKTNIIVAEPMPGEPELRREFVHTLDPKLAKLVERVFERMELAGEAGSLLRIENDIRDAVRETYGEIGGMFRASDEERWQQAESDVLKALRDYAEDATDGRAYQRRLFADDAARGLGLIDLCRHRYDVVLMNPPFGEFAQRYKASARKEHPNAYNDILAAFTMRWHSSLVPGGLLGAITSRTCFFLTTFAPWRRILLFEKQALVTTADLGGAVMDDATVEAAAYVLAHPGTGQPTLFFRLLSTPGPEKPKALALSVRLASSAEASPSLYVRRIASYALLPDGPIPYWVPSEDIAALGELPRFEPAAGVVRQGMVTGDNPRFVRALWEVPPHRIATRGEFDDQQKLWAPLVMKGASQPWYSPLTVVVRWARYGAEIKARWVHKGDHPSRNIRSEELYFQPGISWTRRAVRFIPYAVPVGCIPTASRYMAFPRGDEVAPVLGMMASNAVSAFLRFYGEWFTRPNYLVENVKAVPWPEMPSSLRDRLASVVVGEVRLRRLAYENHEPFHDYVAPSLVRPTSASSALTKDLAGFLPATLEAVVARSLGMAGPAFAAFTRDLQEAVSDAAGRQRDPDHNASASADEDDDDGCSILAETRYSALESLVSYAVGGAFGRWDVLQVLNPERVPSALGPVEALPLCPPGMLTAANGLPVDSPPSGYPIDFPRDGVLVDDKGHDQDVVARAYQVLQVVLGEEAEFRWREAAEILDARGRDVRAWLARTFFESHIKCYSKGRRKAPIYWQLATPSASYSVWLYYHRFTHDTLYRVLNDYVASKLKHEERELTSLVQDAGPNPSTSQRKEFDVQGRLVEELHTFHEEMSRVAPLWNPDLNDGVIINFAPLWRLVPQHRAWQKECRDCWDKLVAGEYEWAHLAMHLWPERVVPKCADDRSLAIAHGLEDVFWAEGSDGKWQKRNVDSAAVGRLVAERTSSAVKDALRSLLDAPSPSAGRGRSKKSASPRRAASTEAV